MSLIIFDTEVISNGNPFDEILEIGAYKVDEENGTLIERDSFQSLIKPIYHKKIPKRIKKLCHFTENDFKNAPSFDEAQDNFQKWAGPDPTYISWGWEDKRWIKINCRVYSIPYQWITGHYMDLQKKYKKIRKEDMEDMNIKKGDLVSLKNAAVHEGIEFDEEKAHRALEDAYNAMKIFEKVYPLM